MKNKFEEWNLKNMNENTLKTEKENKKEIGTEDIVKQETILKKNTEQSTFSIEDKDIKISTNAEKMDRKKLGNWNRFVSPKGYNKWELLSALQKDIRRGNEKEAALWAKELESFVHAELWNRLKIIASEDIGIANPIAPIVIETLHAEYEHFKKINNQGYRLFLVNAVLFLARSPKSRIVDNLLNIVYNDEKTLEIPDYALDKHTIRGKKMGRGFEHFFAEGAKIEKQALEDPYEKLAKEILMKRKT